jgi:molecular chaperone HtpG
MAIRPNSVARQIEEGYEQGAEEQAIESSLRRLCCSLLQGGRIALLKSLSQGDTDFALIPLLDDKADKKKDETGVDEAMTIALIKDALGERVSDVRASQRLTASASCLVAGGDAHDRMLERLLAMQNKAPTTRPILEINMRHPMVAAIAGDKDAAKDLSFLLLEQAQILDGELPEDPAAFANRLNALVLRGLAKG